MPDTSRQSRENLSRCVAVWNVQIAHSRPDPPHSHPHEQVSYVAKGEILFLMDDQGTRLGPGDMFLVSSGKPHSIQQLTEHVRLVDCFTPIREDFLA